MVLGADTGAGCVQDDGGGAHQRRDRGPERDMAQGRGGSRAATAAGRAAAGPEGLPVQRAPRRAWQAGSHGCAGNDRLVLLLFDEGGGVGGVDRHLHHVQLAGVPTCAAASTLTHTAAGVGEGRGQEGCRLVRPRQAPVRVLRVVHALPSRVVRPAARAFLSRSSPMIAAPRGADGRGARARCRHPAPWSPRGRRREKRQLSPRHRVPPPR